MRFDLKAKSSGRWAALAAVCVIGLAPVSVSASDNPGADFGLGLGSFVTSHRFRPRLIGSPSQTGSIGARVVMLWR